MDKKIIIAIDGHSSCGKSTMAKALARELGYIYVDTGAMYRGVGLAAYRAGLLNTSEIDLQALAELLSNLEMHFELNAEGLPELYIGGECVEREIRSVEVALYASQVASIGLVREAMTALQQRMGKDKGIVMDGRDIGTVVFPEAELKIFVTADPRVRGERRYLELQAKGDTPLSLEEVVRSIEERDLADSTRAIAPLKQAHDARLLDNTYLTREEQMERLRQMYHEVISR